MRKHSTKHKATRARMLILSIAALVPLLPVLCSCSLLPVEEEPPPAPILRSYEKVDYILVEASLGDIIETINVSCQYSPAVEETLSFSVGNLPIVNVYVSNGDLVERGDILAELDCSDVNLQIESQEVYRKKLGIELTRLVETHESNLQIQTLKLESLKEKLEDSGDEEKNVLSRSIEVQQQAISSLIENHNLQVDILNIRIDVARKKLNELQKIKSNRILVAGIDGTVTYVKETGVNSFSVEKEKFVTIADKSTSVFIVSGDNASLFNVGDAVSIQLSGEYHDATVIDAEELNLERSDRLAYLQLDETAFDIKENATGVIGLELDRRDNVIYVPRSAIKTADGQEIVYVLNDDNIRTMQKVVTGFSADNKVEIVDGLEPGDRAIIE